MNGSWLAYPAAYMEAGGRAHDAPENIAEGLDRTARLRGDHPAIVFEDRVLGYRELALQAAAVATGLARAGIARGDRVGIFLPNVPVFAVVYHALVRIGAVAVSINVMSKRDEVRHILNDCAATALVTTGDLLANVPPRPEIPSVREVFADESLSALLAGPADGSPPVAVDADTPAAILYTSGTTGRSKGAVLTHGNVVSNVEATRTIIGMREDDVTICFLPLFHCFGQNFVLNATLYAGATLVLQRRFVPDDALAVCERHRVTMFFGVPTVYIALLAHSRAAEALRGVRYFFSAAAILPTHVERSWQERTGLHIHEGYGLTETSPFASYNHSRAHKAGAVGAPIAGVEMRVIDPDGRPLGDGEVGELCIKGPNVMRGYFGRPEETARAIVDGWFRTGDVGYRDAEGDYFLVDRVKDMINVGGFKVWPREVEEVLFEHPGVRESAVVGMPDDMHGEAVKAFVIPREGTALDAAQIVAYCREKLSAYKIPKHVEIVATIPKGATGKILKKDLR
jgi:long-chain acyl-CoA synthetase